MTMIDLTEILDQQRRNIRDNVRMFKKNRDWTNAQLAEATGLKESRVQALTMRNVASKNASYWDAAEVEAVANAWRIPLHLFFMPPEDAWESAMRLGLVKRPPRWSDVHAGQGSLLVGVA